jgi:hypothetical protein
MKTLISILVGLAIFCLGFWLDSQFINWVASMFEGHNVILGVKVILWIFTFSIITTISIYLGILAGSLTRLILD